MKHLLKVCVLAGFMAFALGAASQEAQAEPVMSSWYGPGLAGNLTGSRRHLPSFGPTLDAALRRYLESLQKRMRGTWDWSQKSGRYQKEPHKDALTPLTSVSTIAVQQR